MSALATIARIAANVFKESVRDKVLYSLVLFAVLLIAASFLLSQMTAGQEVKIIKDLGLAAISFFGLFIAVFIGIGLVSKEVEKRSVYSLLTKPITRPQFILGKYLGLLATLTVNVVVMTAALYAVLALYRLQTPHEIQQVWEAPALDPALMLASWLILEELALVTAVALLFSTFSGPILSAAFTFGIIIIGNFSADLKNLDAIIESPAATWLGRVLYYTVPNLASFDVKTLIVHGQPVPWTFVGLSTMYGLAYVVIVLLLAMWIFARRDFK